MKKFIVFAVVLALLVPAMAMVAATEFSLGGFIKMDAMWDSDAACRQKHEWFAGVATMGLTLPTTAG